MRKVTLMDVYTHPVAQKYLNRSGKAHAIACAYHAFKLAVQAGINPDLAVKAALLHDIGHYEWYTDGGEWDYETYRRNDIHAIKGAERAHKLLIRLGDNQRQPKILRLRFCFIRIHICQRATFIRTHSSKSSRKQMKWMKSLADIIITDK